MSLCSNTTAKMDKGRSGRLLHHLFRSLCITFISFPTNLALISEFGFTFFFSFSEAKARKAVTYNYACMLVLLVVQSSNDLRTMEQFAAPLLTLAKADDTNAKLQGNY